MSGVGVQVKETIEFFVRERKRTSYSPALDGLRRRGVASVHAAHRAGYWAGVRSAAARPAERGGKVECPLFRPNDNSLTRHFVQDGSSPAYFEYEETGACTKIIDSSGGVTYFEYNAAGMPKTEKSCLDVGLG